MQSYQEFDIIKGLTTDAQLVGDKPTLLYRFARDFGWNPSYHLTPSGEDELVNIHLVVEHGMENTAILTFLKSPYADLTENVRNNLLNLSYNNLVDWHIHIEAEKITYVNNRLTASKNVVASYPLRRDNYEQLRSDAFDKIVGRKINPNLPALDDSLINTISHWKRSISSELENDDINEALSNLFNAIIFIRAIEDNRKRHKDSSNKSKTLMLAWEALKDEQNSTIESIIKYALQSLNDYYIPDYLINYSQFNKINAISKQTIVFLFNDFYRNRNAFVYEYDFSIISMHALSRIYERYIAILKVEKEIQLSLFPSFRNLAREEINKTFGSIFTPQYIARFFAQYLKENLSPAEFKRTKIAEPAVGSGIFLRSILEIKCDPRGYGLTNEEIISAFKNVFGIDIDSNATKATELSLALLQLVLIDEFPTALNIVNEETINYVSEHEDLKGTFDAVLSNPPFISTDNQTENMRRAIASYMGDLHLGKADSYLTFIKIGIDLLKPGGYGMFVLPHSFMVASSGQKLRQYISETCWVRCIADLSAISVFENTGVYIILLIFQKKSTNHFLEPAVTVVKCKDFVGKALQAALKNNFVDTDFYSVYEINQSDLQSKQWFILPVQEIRLQRKVDSHPPISKFLNVKQGFISGNDGVFIRNVSEIPHDEGEIYVPYLPDRSIDSYKFDSQVSESLFYPFIKNKKITQERMIEEYPKTWKYLLGNKAQLISKKNSNEDNWWRPARTRNPEDLLRAKIITPHLTVIPKFAIDREGIYAVSHAPYLFINDEDLNSEDLLIFFLGVLNSSACYWYISAHSHKYSKGYNMLEVKTLKDTPVPDPSTISSTNMREFLKLVRERLDMPAHMALDLDRRIDIRVANMYGLGTAEMEVLGISSYGHDKNS